MDKLRKFAMDSFLSDTIKSLSSGFISSLRFFKYAPSVFGGILTFLLLESVFKISVNKSFFDNYNFSGYFKTNTSTYTEEEKAYLKHGI